MVVIPNSAKYLVDELAWAKYCDQLWKDRTSPSKAPAKYPCWVDRADTYAGSVLDVAVLYFMYPQELVVKPLEWGYNDEGLRAYGLSGYYLIVQFDDVFECSFRNYNDTVIHHNFEDSIDDGKRWCDEDHRDNVLSVFENFTNYKHNV